MNNFVNVNIYPLLCELAQIDCHETNGTFDIFKDYTIFKKDPFVSSSTSVHVNALYSIIVLLKFLFN
jgi:hypothetical protein